MSRYLEKSFTGGTPNIVTAKYFTFIRDKEETTLGKF